MTLADALKNPLALVGPNYSIYRYTDQIYKIVHFKSPRSLVERRVKCDRTTKGNSEKLDAAISRAKRVVLEIALCNKWDWFCTFTLDKDKYDRRDLKKWHKDFTQWIRDQRKKTGCKIRYLLIPEHHADGCWHMHGLFFDIPDTVSFAELRFLRGWKVPNKLVAGSYRCWLECHDKFGFCSLGQLRNPVASAFYISKYISKSFQEFNIAVGGHLYYASHGLMRALLHTHIYEETDAFNHWLTNKYEFVETGMTYLFDELDWTFGLDLDILQLYEHVVPLDQVYAGDMAKVEDEFDYLFDGVQQMLSGFEDTSPWREIVDS